ncbi:permease-like cell division protein FtsX [Pullulanibacillus sp. KACC 23026]|uniref:permease-like cell division protein FtsX n=1 Tax=Pullulanibacillus sp. KACC 23026 TaxID=3028315 RepID=UPI0023B1A9D8|nr:permease-like cell division protein FtsX [Pullulanibacillus sp. KACC 23026]WEG13602.1 permease-like cell division protein FtsX [Pullulanibacillus sp. KACC 23026]
MKLRTVGRHTKESFKSLARNGWMTFASISSVTVALLLVGVFLTVMLNLNNIAQQVENNVEVRVFIDNTATPAQQQELKANIQKIKNVKSITFLSKEEGLKELIKDMGSDSDVFKSLEGSQNPLPDAYVIKTYEPKQTIAVASAIQKLQYVDSVRYGKGIVEKLFKVIDVARNVGIVLILGLLFTSIFLIANTIKLTIVSRQKEIEIMKLVGATNSFVRWPFFLEGFVLGVVGALIPSCIIGLGYHELYTLFINNNYQSYVFIKLIPFKQLVFQLTILLVVIGGCIGVWGSTNSIRKFLKV